MANKKLICGGLLAIALITIVVLVILLVKCHNGDNYEQQHHNYKSPEWSKDKIDETIYVGSYLDPRQLDIMKYGVFGEKTKSIDEVKKSFDEFFLLQGFYDDLSIDDYGAAVGQPIIRGMSGPRVKIQDQKIPNRVLDDAKVDKMEKAEKRKKSLLGPNGEGKTTQTLGHDYALTDMRQWILPRDQWFDFWDKDRSGELNQKEVVRALLNTLGLTSNQSQPERMRLTVKSIWPIFDPDGSGQIDHSEFIQPDGLADTVLATVAHGLPPRAGGTGNPQGRESLRRWPHFYSSQRS